VPMKGVGLPRPKPTTTYDNSANSEPITPISDSNKYHRHTRMVLWVGVHWSLRWGGLQGGGAADHTTTNSTLIPPHTPQRTHTPQTAHTYHQQFQSSASAQGRATSHHHHHLMIEGVPGAYPAREGVHQRLTLRTHHRIPGGQGGSGGSGSGGGVDGGGWGGVGTGVGRADELVVHHDL